MGLNSVYAPRGSVGGTFTDVQSDHRMDNPLKQLDIADPQLGREIRNALDRGVNEITRDHQSILVEQVFWGVNQEISLGWALGQGCAALMASVTGDAVRDYLAAIHLAAKKGPTLARILAVHLVPVYQQQDHSLLDRFHKTVSVMLKKGVYTLRAPLRTANELLQGGEITSARSYLALLQDIFARDLTYNRCLFLTRQVPHAVMGLPPGKRAYQIRSLRRVAAADLELLDPIIDSLTDGLELLDEKGLNRFVSRALARFDQNRSKGKKFLALESREGRNTISSLQVTAPLDQVRGRLMNYLQARTGRPLIIRALSTLSAALHPPSIHGPTALSDGRSLYLPDEIDLFPNPAANRDLYRHLAGFEAGYFEFGTFDFDLERFRDHHAGAIPAAEHTAGKRSDLETYWCGFAQPDLAADLFTAFEHARIWEMLGRQYPGLVKKTLPVFREEAKRISIHNNLLGAMYARITLKTRGSGEEAVPRQWRNFMGEARQIAGEAFKGQPRVETSAAITATLYPRCEALLDCPVPGNRPAMKTPFNLRVRPDAFHAAHLKSEKLACRLRSALRKIGYHVYKSDIHHHLRKNNGRFTGSDLAEMLSSCDHERRDLKNHTWAATAPEPQTFPETLDLEQLIESTGVPSQMEDETGGQVFWYREWDDELGDYLHRHVRLLEYRIPEIDNGFYLKTLKRRSALVGQIRRAFELLRPEGLQLLRQWVEGDSFDYRALIDFAVDKRAGHTPSERLYIKRIKQFRDVAVMLLVDLSRSTANSVHDSAASVMDVQKEAIVLFCEALEILGDTYAVAGFSGNGRLGADYYRIKDFSETLENPVRLRINAMKPLRNTRMGAAIRHATQELENTDARVRLLIVLGDGFPNDLDYKHAHAIEDTHRAILEARSGGVHTHGITVNIAADPKLDRLFGRLRHNVITDVKELPSKLVRIYHALTH